MDFKICDRQLKFIYAYYRYKPRVYKWELPGAAPVHFAKYIPRRNAPHHIKMAWLLTDEYADGRRTVSL